MSNGRCEHVKRKPSEASSTKVIIFVKVHDPLKDQSDEKHFDFAKVG